MSEIREEPEEIVDMVGQSSINADGKPRRIASKKKKSSVHSHTDSVKTTSTIRTVDLPQLIPHSQPSTYSTLVLPRAVYQPSKHPERVSSAVDITITGVSSTTMSTISITKHGAEALDRRHRRLSLPAVFASSRTSLDTPERLRLGTPSPVTLSSHTPPPNRVEGNQVLVKVCAVALEAVDLLLVKEKSKAAEGYGFIPGRSFTGQVLEIGYEVSNVKRGDWVIGIMEFSKVS